VARTPATRTGANSPSDIASPTHETTRNLRKIAQQLHDSPQVSDLGTGVRGGSAGQGRKTKAPRSVRPACATHLPGLLEWTGPPLVERRALAFDSTCSHRPSRRSARRAMPRFGLGSSFPVPTPLAPLHADPVARAIGPGANWNRPRWVQLGWPQFLRLLNHSSVAHRPSEDAPWTRSPRLAARRSRVAPLPANDSAGLRFPRPPEGGRGPGLTRRPLRSPVTVADSSLPPISRGSPTARSEVAVNTVHDPSPLRLVGGAGRAEAPSSPPRLACALRNEDQ
jgi:hypothetical protein